MPKSMILIISGGLKSSRRSIERLLLAAAPSMKETKTWMIPAASPPARRHERVLDPNE